MAISEEYQKYLPTKLHLPVYLLHHVGASCTALLLAIIAISLLLVAQYNVHESGHMAGCVVSALIHETSISCTYSNWVDVPIFGNYIVLKAPQQTMSGNPGTLLMAIGGPIWSALFFICIGFVGWHVLKVKNRAYWLIPACFILYEFGNILCGTDNMAGKPFLFCSNGAVPLLMQGLPVFAMLVIFLLIYPIVKGCFSRLFEIYIAFLGRKTIHKMEPR